MKYGIIMFEKTENLGDDIQTYAAYKYLPKIDYIIEREKLNQFVPEKDEMVSVIMNGWFFHSQYSLVPSPFINPLFISSHFTNYLKEERPDYLTENAVKYFKKHQPIGLRDDLMKNQFTNLEIENYFSGCLTITIDKFKGLKQENKITLVDIDEELIEYVKDNTNCEIKVTTHTENSAAHSTLTFKDRMEKVKNQLKLYQSSKHVITTRLHVALPCIAMNVPVTLIYEKDNVDVTNRLGKFIEFINYKTRNDFINNKIDLKENNNKHLTMRKNLEKKVNDFIENSKKLPSKSPESAEKYKEYFVNQFSDLEKIIEKKEKEYIEKILFLEKEYKKLEILNKATIIERNLAIEEIEKNYGELNSKSFKIYKSTIEKIRKIKGGLRK